MTTDEHRGYGQQKERTVFSNVIGNTILHGLIAEHTHNLSDKIRNKKIYLAFDDGHALDAAASG